MDGYLCFPLENETNKRRKTTKKKEKTQRKQFPNWITFITLLS